MIYCHHKNYPIVLANIMAPCDWKDRKDGIAVLLLLFLCFVKVEQKAWLTLFSFVFFSVDAAVLDYGGG